MDPHNYPRPRSTTPWGLIIGIGCGGCLLIIVMMVVGGVFLFKAGTKAYNEVDPVARKFAGHVFAGDSDSAYAMISEQWKQRQSREQFDTWLEYCRKSMGGAPELKFYSYHVLAGPFRSETLTYRAESGPNTAMLKVTLIRASGQIRIDGAAFSPGTSPERE